MLTLRRLVEAVRDYDRPVDLAIETKHPTRYAGLVERRLVDLLESVGWAGAGSPARVMSFSPVALTRIKKLAPALEVVLLIDRQYSWQMATQHAAARLDRGTGDRPAAARTPGSAGGCAGAASASTSGP